MLRRASIVICIAAITGALVSTTERSNYETLVRIQQEGLERSQVMDHLWWLSEVHGPRLTGSPGIRGAGDWAIKRFNEWGLAGVRAEKWKFGKGWSLVRFHAHMVEPQIQPIIGFPKSWTPGTEGTVLAEVVRVAINSEVDFAKYRGRLAGKIVLTQPAREVRMLEERIAWRMTDELTREAETLQIPGQATAGVSPSGGVSLQDKIQEFFVAEKVVAAFDRGIDSAVVSMGGREDLSAVTQRVDGGTIFVGVGGPRDETAGKSVVPQVTLAVEHYNRMVRLLEKGIPVTVELHVQAEFHEEEDMNGFNVIAELPGTDLKEEIVVLGAHLDSHHSGVGATDNAAGCAVVMEAVRILKAIGVAPRRTIRVALWGGEEQGYAGARAYVREHIADRGTMQLKPGHRSHVAYYNIDNGAGRIRGVWMQGNLALTTIFSQWIQPLKGLGVTTLSPRSVTGSDYVAFDEVGIPAFQFIQDRLEYRSRTHHSNMDVFDRVQREDVVQAAVVLATFAYNTAMRDEPLPRKPLPIATRPSKSTLTPAQQK
jgi:carboxypeptidase Q